ncbi:hypothetical protein GCM10027355_04830 [Haloplanus salinarum]
MGHERGPEGGEDGPRGDGHRPTAVAVLPPEEGTDEKEADDGPGEYVGDGACHIRDNDIDR